MKWMKGVFGAALIGVAMGITGCYTVIMMPRTVETVDNEQWSQEESFADTTAEKEDDGQVVNNFYIYDDWPGHWYFDPFWDSPYHWRYSSWWGGAFYDPWWDPWPYYGYSSWGWSPYHRFGYGYHSPLDWYSPGYNDPYWVYMDGYHGPGRADGKRQPFDRHDSIHNRGGLDGSGFSATSQTFSNGISRVGKASGTATDPGMGTHRIRRTTTESATQSSGTGVSTTSSSHRIRRTESVESSGSTMKAARGSSGKTKPATTQSGGSDHRVRRGSSTSSSGSVSSPSPSHSGSSGSSGSRAGSSSSGSSGSSSRSSSPPSSSGSSGSGSHRTRR